MIEEIFWVIVNFLLIMVSTIIFCLVVRIDRMSEKVNTMYCKRCKKIVIKCQASEEFHKSCKISSVCDWR
jgi:hypothetical protein